MVQFNNTLDIQTFNECLKYVQDTLHWLVAEEENRRDTLARFPPPLLDRTTTTLTTLLHHGARHLQNTRVPINQLPPEILRHVLLYLQDAFVPIGGHPLDEAWLSRYPSNSWHRTSLVCRQWRWVVLNTAEFWTTIKIRKGRRAQSNNWSHFMAGLSRSKTLPLTIRFETPLDSSLSERGQVNAVLDEAHRVRELRAVVSDDTGHRWLQSFVEHASQVEVLVLRYGHHPVQWACQLPRLCVLHMTNSLAWQSWSATTLRCLSLSDQRWRASDVLGLRTVLAGNPLLEELLLDDIDVIWSLEIQETLQSLPLLGLPNLKRLLVRAVMDPDTEMVDVRSIAEHLPQMLVHPPHCAQQHIFPNHTSVHAIVKPSTPFPMTGLFMGTYTIVATDGSSAFAVELGNRTNIYESLDYDAIRELWVTTCGGISYSPVNPPIQVLQRPKWQGVKKLVITRDPTFWLGHLGSRAGNFPLLEELHIHDLRNRHGTTIIGFLMKRQRAGFKIKELRFVRDLFFPHEAFHSWNRGSWKFAKHVGRVVFEDLYPGIDDLSVVSAPARTMELPEICTTHSPVSSLWKPWNETVAI